MITNKITGVSVMEEKQEAIPQQGARLDLIQKYQKSPPGGAWTD